MRTLCLATGIWLTVRLVQVIVSLLPPVYSPVAGKATLSSLLTFSFGLTEICNLLEKSEELYSRMEVGRYGRIGREPIDLGLLRIPSCPDIEHRPKKE
jgi:hypothetical protein